MFIARPPASPLTGYELGLKKIARRAFDGSAEFLSDSENRDRIAEYLADVAKPYGNELVHELSGQSYGEMAQALIDSTVSPREPVDLLILAFSSHDLRPGRQTAAYLSHVTPGAPMAFAVCDQGSAATFSAMRIARDYMASAGLRRSLVIVLEQADLPYHSSGPMPLRHQAVALLLGESATARTRVVGVRQHPAIPPGEVAARAAHELKELSAGQGEVALVLGETIATQWTSPDAAHVRVAQAGQPSTGIWWTLADELDHAGTVIAADYDAQLNYLCLTAFETATR